MKDQPNVVVGRSAKFSAQETIFGAFNKDSVQKVMKIEESQRRSNISTKK